VDQPQPASAAVSRLPLWPCGRHNPCPAAGFGDPQRACRCRRSPSGSVTVRLSGPLLDRMTLQVVMRRLEADDCWVRGQPPPPPPPP